MLDIKNIIVDELYNDFEMIVDEIIICDEIEVNEII